MKPSKPYEEVQITPTLIWRWVREGDEYVMRISEMALEAHKAHIEAALAQPEHPDLRKAADMALDALKYNQSNWYGKREAIAALEAELAKPEFDTPESHIVKWSIPVDPNNFGEALSQPEQALEQNAESDKLLITLIQEQRSEIDRLRQALAQPEHPLDKKADNARDLGLDYEPDAVQPKE